MTPDHSAESLEAAVLHFPPDETHLLPSVYVGDTYQVQIMLPARSDGDAGPLPVVYLTDANLAYEMCKGIARVLQLSEQGVPPFMLVGVGYPGASPVAGVRLRIRDFTFDGYPRVPISHLPWGDVLQPPPGTKDFGGAIAFQQFLEFELIPFVEATYGCSPGTRTYFGHSGGASFGLMTLFTRPNLFTQYIISSPGVSFSPHGSLDSGERNWIVDLVGKAVSSGQPLPATAYMSVGSEEEDDPQLAGWHLTTTFLQVVELLQGSAIPALDVHSEVLTGETHASAWPVAFAHGVRAVFPKLLAAEQASNSEPITGSGANRPPNQARSEW